MLLVNRPFYRSTRESAFTITLTFAQIEKLVEIQRDIGRYNTQSEVNRKNRELRKRLADANLYCPDTEDYLYEVIPEFVEEGDGTDCQGQIPANPTVRCLVEKGLITGWKFHKVLTRAGHLALQMLQVSGHVQELKWAQDAVKEVTHENQIQGQ